MKVTSSFGILDTEYSTLVDLEAWGKISEIGQQRLDGIRKGYRERAETPLTIGEHKELFLAQEPKRGR